MSAISCSMVYGIKKKAVFICRKGMGYLERLIRSNSLMIMQIRIILTIRHIKLEKQMNANMLKKRKHIVWTLWLIWNGIVMAGLMISCKSFYDE